LITSSGSPFGVGDGDGIDLGNVACEGRLLTDGPMIVLGVGVGLGFCRPDCAATDVVNMMIVRKIYFIKTKEISHGLTQIEKRINTDLNEVIIGFQISDYPFFSVLIRVPFLQIV
jgi:hypothetical protein